MNNKCWIFQEIDKSNYLKFDTYIKNNYNNRIIYFIDNDVKNMIDLNGDNVKYSFFKEDSKSFMEFIFEKIELLQEIISNDDFVILSYSCSNPIFKKIENIDFSKLNSKGVDFVNFSSIRNEGPFGGADRKDFFYRYEKGSFMNTFSLFVDIKNNFKKFKLHSVYEDVLFGYLAESRSHKKIYINSNVLCRRKIDFLFSKGSERTISDNELILAIEAIKYIDSYTRISNKDYVEMFKNLALFRKNKNSKEVVKFIKKIYLRDSKKILEFFNNKYDGRNINFDFDEFAKVNKIETINFIQYQEILFDIFRKFMAVMDNYNIRTTSIGLTILGQINNGFPLKYDDDIDVIVSLKSFYKNRKNIKADLEKEGIYMSIWHEKNFHNYTPTVSKVFTNKIYRIIDLENSINTIATPFVDFSYSSDLKNVKFNNFNYFVSKKILNYRTDSKLSSKSILYFSHSLKKWLPIKNEPRIKFKFWYLKLRFWLSVYNFGMLFSRFTLEKNYGPSKIITYDFDQMKWGGFDVTNDENIEFLGVDNLMHPQNYVNAYEKRYGKKPQILKDENANLSHLNKEGISFLTNDHNWMNSKNIKNITNINGNKYGK